MNCFIWNQKVTICAMLLVQIGSSLVILVSLGKPVWTGQCTACCKKMASQWKSIPNEQWLAGGLTVFNHKTCCARGHAIQISGPMMPLSSSFEHNGKHPLKPPFPPVQFHRPVLEGWIQHQQVSFHRTDQSSSTVSMLFYITTWIQRLITFNFQRREAHDWAKESANRVGRVMTHARMFQHAQAHFLQGLCFLTSIVFVLRY